MSSLPPENSSSQKKNPLFFSAKLFVLSGLFIIGFFLFTAVGLQLLPHLFGVSIKPDDILSEKLKNPNYIVAYKFLQIIYAFGAFALPAFTFAQNFKKKEMYAFLGLKATLKPTIIGLSLLACIFYNPVIEYIYSLNKLIPLPKELINAEKSASLLTDAFLSGNSYYDLMMNLLLVAAIPAFCEELFFRGAVFGFINEWTKKPYKAMLISAIIFSIIHFQFQGFFPRVILGFYLAYLFYITGSIWVSMLAHFLSNGFTVFAVWLSHNGYNVPFVAEDFQFPLWQVLVSLILTSIAIYFIHLHSKKVISNE